MLGVPCIFLTASKQPGLRDQRATGRRGVLREALRCGGTPATIRATLEAPADEGDLPDAPIRTWIIDETADLPVSRPSGVIA